jgi:hypothetical protein
MEYSLSNNFFHSYSEGPGQDTSRLPYKLGRYESKFSQKFKPGYFKIGFTKKLHIFSQCIRNSIKLVRICMDFFSGSVDQCAVGMIEKGLVFM